VKWTTLSDTQLLEEVGQSLRVLSGLVGQTVKSIAIPFGSYDRRVLRLLKLFDITTVFTSDGGPSRPNTWVKPRTTIRRDTPPEKNKLLLSGQLSPMERFRFCVQEARRSIQAL
jgi:hypothetical protein